MEAAEKFKPQEFTGELIQLVTFTLDSEEYGLNVLKVREIIRMSAITRVPNTPPYVDGVINLRGKVIPVFSIRKKLGLSKIERDDRTRIIVMEVNGELLGTIVDGVAEVIRVTESEIQQAPAMAGTLEQEYVAGVINLVERLLIMLDVEALFTKDMNAIPVLA